MDVDAVKYGLIAQLCDVHVVKLDVVVERCEELSEGDLFRV